MLSRRGTAPPNEPREGHEVTRLLLAWRDGDHEAFEALIPLVYKELRGVARRLLLEERRNRTLQTADLVHETYMRLVDSGHIEWQNRAHFLAVAARSMRRVLVDAARARQSLKRGGAHVREELDEALTIAVSPHADVIELDAALETLAAVDPRRSRVVELRFFGGLTVEETAAALEVSPETVMRDWKVARAWLFSRIGSTRTSHFS
jgi:RNA polymerase sigma factor (TIGR02999 family)